MRLIITTFCLLVFSIQGYSQKSFHVFPKDHLTNKGSENGDGSMQKPWDLKTALGQSPKIVNGGDTIWLHGGVYSGKFRSKLKSTISNKNIIVSSYKGEWAILNGNISGSSEATLTVIGNNVTFKDFEISPVGTYSRNENDDEFNQFGGINHNSGANCKFINLVIHGNNGLGFGSWKKTGGTIISNCIVFDNGFKGKDYEGLGEGFYVQNDSDEETRIIKDNIIFNNYYKGIEVWSAGKKATREYVKNITLYNNVIFNSGLPSGRTVDNIIIASNDRNGINIPKNINVKNNILYHNTNYKLGEVNGDAPSLTLGYYHKSPVENVKVLNNIILGRNNPLRLLHTNSISIKNNIFYGGYIHTTSKTTKNLESNSLNNNIYYTKNKTPFIIEKRKSPFDIWQSTYKQDINSQHKSIRQFDLPPVLDITKNEFKANSYRVVLFSKNEEAIQVDFSDFIGKKNVTYTVRDVENLDAVLMSGELSDSFFIKFPMTLKPTANKTLNNFGVFIVDFEEKKSDTIEEQESFIKRLFNWLF